MRNEGNLWIAKRKTIIFMIAVVMLVVIGASFIGIFKEEDINKTEEYKPYDSMYNASRYFFRVYYPDDWDVEAGTYGFMLDSEEDLVLEVFPLKKMSATATPAPEIPTETPTSAAEPSATVDPRAGMERDSLFSMNIYYKEYGEILDELEARGAFEYSTDSTATDSESNIIYEDANPTGDQAQGTNDSRVRTAIKNEVLAEYVFETFMNEKAESNYTFLAPKIYNGNTIEYCVLPFEYVENDIKMTGELYVASRGMAYYEILTVGTDAAFAKYDSVKNNIIYNIKFSVFDY